MAEFCLNCFNIINGENKTEDDVITQWDFCEKCKKNAPCVLYVKTEEQKRLEKERELDE
ncbi:MAG: hypothetical protein ACI4VQ_05870 [Clostridia bacterium]